MSIQEEPIQFVCPTIENLHDILPNPSENITTWSCLFITEMLSFAEHINGNRMDIVIDMRTHPIENLLYPGFQELQHGALCIYVHNTILDVDAMNELVLQSRAHFNVGFLSGFLVSDCAQIASGTNYFIIDPATRFLVDDDPFTIASNSNMGCARRYDINGTDIRNCPDHLAPFSNLLLADYRNCTILRFPFRQSPSSIFSYTMQNYDRHIEQFLQVAQNSLRDCLVFTESVAHVSVWCLKNNKVSTPSSPLDGHIFYGECILLNPDEVLGKRSSMRRNTEWKRESFISPFSGIHEFFTGRDRSSSHSISNDESLICFTIQLKICYISQTEDQDVTEHFQDLWLLSHNIGLGKTRSLATTHSQESWESTPYTAVACHLLRNGVVAPRLAGHVFISDNTTQHAVDSAVNIGLPVHIHGGFDYRRKRDDRNLIITTSATSGLAITLEESTQQDTDMNQRHQQAKWNRALLKDGVASAYLNLLEFAKTTLEESSSSSNALYNIWPVLSKEYEVGKLLQTMTYQKIKDHELFLCSDGIFRSLQLGYLVNFYGMHLQVASFAQIHFPSLNLPVDIVEDCCRMLPYKVRKLTPSAMRSFLRTLNTSRDGQKDSVSYNLCLPLLEYCLRDIDEPFPKESASVWYEFHGLPILPLEGGEVGVLKVNQRSSYYVGTFDEIQLMSNPIDRKCCRSFISMEAYRRLSKFFKNDKFLAIMGITKFSARSLAEIIEDILPLNWKGKEHITLTLDGKTNYEIWLYRFWRHISLGDVKVMRYFQDWPLIPLTNGSLLSCSKFDRVFFIYERSKDTTRSTNLSNLVCQEADTQIRRLDELDFEYARLVALSTKKYDKSRSLSIIGSEESSDTSQISNAFEKSLSSCLSEENSEPEFERPDTLLDSGVVTTNDSDEDHNDREMLHLTISKLNGPMLDFVYFENPDQVVPAMKDIVSHILHRMAACPISSLNWSLLTTEDANRLVDFFYRHMEGYGTYDMGELELLRQLPIYERSDSKLTSVHDGGRLFFIVPPELAPLSTVATLLPCTESNNWLAWNDQTIQFYSSLGISVMGMRDLLLLLLPKYSSTGTTTEECDAILSLLIKGWREGSLFQLISANEEISVLLQSTKLFRNDLTMTFHTANEFVDPRHALLSTIFDENDFPPEVFRCKDWLDFMCCIGMCHEITLDNLIRCGKKIESLYSKTTSVGEKRELTPQRLNVILTLHAYFRSHYEQILDAKGLGKWQSVQELAQVAFVPAIIYHFGQTPEHVVVRYADCVTPEDASLAFAASAILHPEAVPPSVIWNQLGMQSPPSKTIVFQHLFAITRIRQGIDEGSSWHFYAMSQRQIFQDIFYYLRTRWLSLSDSDHILLKCSPIFPVGLPAAFRFVMPSQVYYSLPTDFPFAPLLYELPKFLYQAQNKSLFESLGVRQYPQVDDLIDCLRTLARDKCHAPLDVNELVAVRSVIRTLVSMLTISDQHTIIREHVFIPSSSGVMEALPWMVYDDASWLDNHIFFDSLSVISIVHPSIYWTCCEVLGIPRLSDIVHEYLDPVPSVLDILAPSESIITLNNKLKSTELAVALERIYASEMDTKSGMQEASLPCFERLKHYCIQCVPQVKTSFYATMGSPPVRITLPPRQTAKECRYFVANEECKIYISKCTVESCRLSQVLSECISMIVGYSFQNYAIIEALLLSDSSEIDKLLQEYRVCSLNLEDWKLKERTRGLAGQHLSKNDSTMVEIAPWRSLNKGELVACMSGQDNELQYAIVLDVKEPFGNSEAVNVRNVLLQISNTEQKWIPQSQVYIFHAKSTSPNKEVNINNELDIAVMQASMPSLVQHSIADSNESPTTNPAHTSTIINAVNSLLARLNFSLSSTHAELLEGTVRLQQALAHAEERAEQATWRLETLLHEKKNTDDLMTCAICLEAQVDRVLIPCGHVYCNTCITQFPTPICPICRQPIRQSSIFHVPL